MTARRLVLVGDVDDDALRRLVEMARSMGMRPEAGAAPNVPFLKAMQEAYGARWRCLNPEAAQVWASRRGVVSIGDLATLALSDIVKQHSGQGWEWESSLFTAMLRYGVTFRDVDLERFLGIEVNDREFGLDARYSGPLQREGLRWIGMLTLLTAGDLGRIRLLGSDRALQAIRQALARQGRALRA